jgi:hypothetical protein
VIIFTGCTDKDTPDLKVEKNDLSTKLEEIFDGEHYLC